MKKVLIIIALLLFIECSYNGNLTGTVDTTDVQISLCGFVGNDEGEGVPHLIATLPQIGISDTTDSRGKYKITISHDSLVNLGINLDTLLDTLEVRRSKNIIMKFAITKWVDTLPEIYLIKRNVSGILKTSENEFKRIEAVISAPGISRYTIELDFNPVNSSFSGYILFPYLASHNTYDVYVNVFNKDSLFTGRSETVKVREATGDISIKEFNPFNALPIVDAGRDISTGTNRSITLLGNASDAFGGVIERWEWDVGATGSFVEVSPGSGYTIITPSTPTEELPCILRVTDNDGNVVTDKLTILVTEFKGKMIRIFAKDHSFQMGTWEGSNGYDDEKPKHNVLFTRDFWMDTSEVTQKEYTDVMSAAYPGYSQPPWSSNYGIGETYPAYNITWYDAALYCNALSRAEGLDTAYMYSSIDGVPGNGCKLVGLSITINFNGYRLPTEAEWEYACRAGTETDYSWGSEVTDVDNFEWYGENSNSMSHPVCSKWPNSYGLYDMGGNVSEYCNDYYDPFYYVQGKTGIVDPKGPLKQLNFRVYRGANFNLWYGRAEKLRSSARNSNNPENPNNYLGFRVVLIKQ